MGMKQTLEVLNQMVSDEIIGSYAIGGAIAAFNYIEPASTDDLDILVSFDSPSTPSRLVTLTPILAYLSEKGYAEHRKEGILIEDWPVRFFPVASALDAEALTGAQPIDIEMSPGAGGVSARVLTAEHVMATALGIGRPKDHIGLNQFIEAGAFDAPILREILQRHGLQAKWLRFCGRFEIADPLKTERES